MADLLQQQYSSVFSHPVNVTDNIDISGKNSTEMCDICFTDEEIKEAINSFSVNSAAGPDGLPAIVLKKCTNSLSLPLKLFWNNCLELGVTPLMLKTSYITPIHKVQDQREPSNYGPVALTSHLIKTFEKII